MDPKVKTSKGFQNAYQQLNPAQQKAVNTLDGPVMVVAGPGTGKTQILATRIANILTKTDTNPSSILALTFTESGASSMRERLISLIGQTGYYVHISTFHSFCSEVISESPEYFSLPSNASALSELERFEIFSEILSKSELEILKPINANEYYVKAIIKSISDLKREGVSAEEFETIVNQEAETLTSAELKKTERMKQEKNLAKHRDLLHIYREYQTAMTRIGRFDFDDMIALVSEAFETQELLLLQYQEKYHYILVDEYQDTNGAQSQVMNLLASYWGDQANLFVVGDINQSIYRFQGASAENVLQFLQTYPKAAVIHLEENYRSTQTILDAASSLIEHNQIRLDTLTGHKHTLESKINQEGSKLQIVHPASGQIEVLYFAETIKNFIQAGTEPSEIAVIYRHNNDSLAISSALAKWGIPYEIDGGVNILTTPIINQLLLLLRAIHGIKLGIEDMDLFTLLNYEWTGLDSLAILKITREAAKRKQPLLDIILEQDKVKGVRGKEKGESNQPTLHISAHTESSPVFDVTQYMPETFLYHEDPEIAKIQTFLLKLTGLLSAESNHTFVTWFEYVLNTTGFLPYLLARPSVIEDLNRVNSLFNEIKRLASLDHLLNLDRFLSIITTMNQNRLSITEEDQNIRKHAVRLTTAHKAKGQEWEHVFLMTVIDKKWGNNTNRELIPLPEGILKTQDLAKKDQNEDERRLFYVALTRAKRHITISIPDTVISGGTSKDTVPSIFTTEIDSKFLETVSLEELERNQAKLLEQLLSPRPPVIVSDDEREFLEQEVKGFKLSPTTLNTYLKCPYKFKLESLLKVPRAKTEHQALGTAVHKALELFFISLQKTKQVPPAEYLLISFEDALKQELLTPEAERVRLKQGLTMLNLYYQEYKDEFQVPLFCERLFGYGWSKTYLGDIGLTGKVDRIDLLDEKEGTVTIVDYKTGRPRSRNEIEGLTGKKDASYKRQLVFYKLLTELDRTFTQKAENFVLDFIEPDRISGKHKRESFLITPQDVEELKAMIAEVMANIRALNFEHTKDLSLCADCEFAQHCWPEGIPNSQSE